MRQVNISTLKNNLSAILDTLEAQGPVIVVDRNRPVAELRQIPSTKIADDARIADLIRRGVLSPAKKTGSVLDVLPRLSPKRKPAGVLEALLKERHEGR